MFNKMDKQNVLDFINKELLTDNSFPAGTENKNPNRCKHRGIFNPPNGNKENEKFSNQPFQREKSKMAEKKTQQSCEVLNPFEGNKDYFCGVYQRRTA